LKFEIFQHICDWWKNSMARFWNILVEKCFARCRLGLSKFQHFVYFCCLAFRYLSFSAIFCLIYILQLYWIFTTHQIINEFITHWYCKLWIYCCYTINEKNSFVTTFQPILVSAQFEKKRSWKKLLKIRKKNKLKKIEKKIRERHFNVKSAKELYTPY